MRFRHLLSDCVRITVVDSEYEAKRAITPLWAFITLSPSAMFSITEISIKDRIARLHYMAHEKKRTHTHTAVATTRVLNMVKHTGNSSVTKLWNTLTRKKWAKRMQFRDRNNFSTMFRQHVRFFFRCCCTRSALFFCVVPSIRLLYSFFPSWSLHFINVKGFCINF